MPASPNVAMAINCNNLGPLSFNDTGSNNQNVGELVPATTTNQEFDIVFAAAALVSVFLVSTVDMTVKTNATGSGGSEQEFDFKAGVPMIWTSRMPIPNPFLHDVTKFYLSNAGSVDGTLYGFILTA